MPPKKKRKGVNRDNLLSIPMTKAERDLIRMHAAFENKADAAFARDILMSRVVRLEWARRVPA